MAAPDAEGELERVRRLVEELEYDAALAALDVLAGVPDRSRNVTLELYRLRGVLAGTLGRESQALLAFRALLMLDFAATLDPAQPPRVQTPYFQAKRWVSDRGPIRLETSVQGAPADSVQLVVRVTGDALGLGKAVFIDLPGHPAQSVLLGRNKVAKLSVPRTSLVDWSATLLGERGARLVSASHRIAPATVVAAEGASSSAASSDAARKPNPPVPHRETASNPVGAGAPRRSDERAALAARGATGEASGLAPPAPEVAPEAASARDSSSELTPEPPQGEPVALEAPSAEPTPGAPPLRTAGLTAGVAGLAAIAAGTIYGVRVQAAQGALASAERDASGTIIGMTQRSAAALDARARREAPVANTLLGVGLALAGAAGVLLAVDASNSRAVIVPSPQGVAVVGAF